MVAGEKGFGSGGVGGRGTGSGTEQISQLVLFLLFLAYKKKNRALVAGEGWGRVGGVGAWLAVPWLAVPQGGQGLGGGSKGFGSGQVGGKVKMLMLLKNISIPNIRKIQKRRFLFMIGAS